MLQRDRQRQRERGTFSGGGAGAFTAEYLVVAGGGGGSVLHSGGGGAGGYRSSVTDESSGGGASAETALSIALGTAYAVTVGAGGASVAVSYSAVSNKGTDSVFDTITSAGGGGGVLGAPDPPPNGDGGSGGGGGAGGVATSPAGSGTANQGFNGGEGSNAGGVTFHGGGGGGASEIGGNSTTSVKAGDGGDGVESYITGSAAYRAGGGGGSSYAHPGGAGGLGGGGNGGGNAAGTAGTANTGGGGGAGGGGNAANVSGAGGSGVVIIRVPSSVVAEFSAGVVYNYIPQDDFNVYEITAAGVSDTVTFSQGAVTTVGESLRFNDDDTAYLDGTYSASATNTKATFAFWYKSGFISASQMLYQARDNNAVNNLRTFLQVAGGTFRVRMYNSAAAQVCALNTTRVFRDPSAWYHLVFQFDTTQATASDRVKLYVNGVLNTDFSVATTYPPLNFAFRTVSSVYTDIGRNGGVNTNLIDGYLADYYFIDGQALDPSRFGKQDADGVWQPISYTGTYGTNGFRLDFADNSTAAALGTDVSGNGNDFTPSGITTDDQVSDTPSVNYCTMNSLDSGAAHTLSDGNLRVSQGGTNWDTTRSTFALTSGKWYWEIGNILSASYIMVGLSKSTQDLAIYPGQDADGYGYYSTNGNLYNSGSTAYGASYGVADTIGVSFDADIGELIFYKNGVSQGVAVTGLTDDLWFPSIGVHTSAASFNFGQRPFAYTPPTGFQALNSANLPAPVIADGKEHFQPALYTGNGTTQAIGGLEFQPDMVWIKSRSTAYDHQIHDAVRGAGIGLLPNLTVAEQPTYNTVTSFNSNGFTVAVNGSFVGTNGAGSTFVGWSWNAGGSTVTNTDGTITSQVRANTDAGFSIMSYTGSGSAGGIGHGLNSAPDLVIAKNRQDSGTTGSTNSNWAVYHSALGYTKNLPLNLANTPISDPNYWGNADPDASVVYVNNYNVNNSSGKSYIMYAFHSVEGFSKFGSYTGNGSTDGPFIYTGFRPAFVIVKSYTNGYYWVMKDNMRAAAYNPATGNLYPNDTLTEDTVATAYFDLLANGFKLRGNYVGTNGSGVGYIYMAFAENPFKTARAR